MTHHTMSVYLYHAGTSRSDINSKNVNKLLLLFCDDVFASSFFFIIDNHHHHPSSSIFRVECVGVMLVYLRLLLKRVEHAVALHMMLYKDRSEKENGFI